MSRWDENFGHCVTVYFAYSFSCCKALSQETMIWLNASHNVNKDMVACVVANFINSGGSIDLKQVSAFGLWFDRDTECGDSEDEGNGCTDVPSALRNKPIWPVLLHNHTAIACDTSMPVGVCWVLHFLSNR